MIPFGYPPMEMRPVENIPDGPEWQYEPKWDGFRCLAFRSEADPEVVLQSKAGQPLGRYFPEIVAALAGLEAEGFVLDGELVVPLAGALSFDALQQRIHPAASRVRMLSETTPAWYLVFDLLAENGTDLVELPLEQRRARLERFAAAFDGVTLRLSPATRARHVVDDWFARVGGALDGVIAKRADLPYASGTRDAAVKVKRARTADCVVGGFRYAKGSTDKIGSLLLGLYDDAGKLDYIGFCSAFSKAQKEELRETAAPARRRAGFHRRRARRCAQPLGPRRRARPQLRQARARPGARGVVRPGHRRAHPARHQARPLAPRQSAAPVHGGAARHARPRDRAAGVARDALLERGQFRPLRSRRAP